MSFADLDVKNASYFFEQNYEILAIVNEVYGS